MVEARLKLEPEVNMIFEVIDDGENFLLSGGAGSGKTYSLVQVIQQIILENPTARIACITYTNAAVKEIEDRVSNKNLSVSTIHDFLWDNIKSFQKDMKKSIVALIASEKIKNPDEEVNSDYYSAKEIQYKEYTLIREGIISHDELLILANHMFETYPKLCNILKSKFRFIFLDEYQDTNKLVIEIVLNHLKQSNKHTVIGFFGDAMQSIYDDGVGDLNAYIESGDVHEIKKGQNRRNPRLVYELANRLRKDGIVQEASKDNAAPNMQDGKAKNGSIKFYYSINEEKLDFLKELLKWNFSDSKETKELNLTHNLIAPRAGFETLMSIYDGDKILEYKKRIIEYIKDKKITDDFSDLSFGQVIDKLMEGKATQAELRPIQPTPTMQTFMDDNPELYEQARNYPFNEFKKIYLDKDALLDDKKESEDDKSKSGSKKDNLIKHLEKIQTNITLYSERKYNEFLRRTEFKIKSVADKRQLKGIITNLQGMTDNTIEEVIEYSHENGIRKKDDKLSDFIKNNKYVYNRIKQVSFQEFQNLFYYIEGYTPFSTQHKIKGAEFDNVLVVLNNGNWSKYNFEYLMNEGIYADLTPARKTSFQGILSRTQKLFYVCCTRAKENLVVYYHNPSLPVIETAKDWFGEQNTHEI